MVSAGALTPEGRYLRLGEKDAFSGLPHRVVAVGVPADGLRPAQQFDSRSDRAAIVVSFEGDAIFALDYAPGSAVPFGLRGQLTHTGGRPQLPGSAALIERGALTGRVLIAENQGVRQVQFAPTTR